MTIRFTPLRPEQIPEDDPIKEIRRLQSLLASMGQCPSCGRPVKCYQAGYESLCCPGHSATGNWETVKGDSEWLGSQIKLIEDLKEHLRFVLGALKWTLPALEEKFRDKPDPDFDNRRTEIITALYAIQNGAWECLLGRTHKGET